MFSPLYRLHIFLLPSGGGPETHWMECCCFFQNSLSFCFSPYINHFLPLPMIFPIDPSLTHMGLPISTPNYSLPFILYPCCLSFLHCSHTEFMRKCSYSPPSPSASHSLFPHMLYFRQGNNNDKRVLWHLGDWHNWLGKSQLPWDDVYKWLCPSYICWSLQLLYNSLLLFICFGSQLLTCLPTHLLSPPRYFCTHFLSFFRLLYFFPHGETHHAIFVTSCMKRLFPSSLYTMELSPISFHCVRASLLSCFPVTLGFSPPVGFLAFSPSTLLLTSCFRASSLFSRLPSLPPLCSQCRLLQELLGMNELPPFRW